MKKKRKQSRYPDFDLIPTSHLLDSVWVRKDRKALKIVFAIGKTLDFIPEDEIQKNDNMIK